MSLSLAQSLVAAFHRKFDLGAPEKPLEARDIDWQHHATRRVWIASELKELEDGIAALSVADTADGYIDILVFALGGLVKLGVQASPLFEAVIESQMTKEKRPGVPKLVKPEGWKHPDIGALIEAQRKR